MKSLQVTHCALMGRQTPTLPLMFRTLGLAPALWNEWAMQLSAVLFVNSPERC